MKCIHFLTSHLDPVWVVHFLLKITIQTLKLSLQLSLLLVKKSIYLQQITPYISSLPHPHIHTLE